LNKCELELYMLYIQYTVVTVLVKRKSMYLGTCGSTQKSLNLQIANLQRATFSEGAYV
jgi:hypothetical protein